MTDYSLIRSGQPPLAFRGELLSEVMPPEAAIPKLKRWHVVRLYRTAAGQYVLEIEFHTVYDPSQVDVEVADDVEDLRLICERYCDDIPEIVAYPVTDRFRERQKELIVRKLQDHFEAAVAQILNRPEFAERI
jgi:hypothetical protein